MMEYEDNPTRPIHGNANGPNQQLLMEEVEEDDEFEMDQLLQDVDSVNRTLLRLYPDMEIDPNMVFEQLEVVKHNADRVFRVVALLSQLHRTFLNNKERQGAVQLENDESVIEKDVEPDVRNAEVASINDAEQTDDVDDVEDGHPVITIIDDPTDLEDVYGGLVQDVNTIMDVFPDADPQEVYAYLEARREEPQRVTNVIEELIHRRPVEKTAAANASPVKQNFPLLSDEEKKRVGDVTDSNVPKKLRTVQKMETEPSPHDVDSSVTEAVDHGVEDMETTSSTSPPIEAKSSSAAPTVEPSTSGQEEDLSASQQLLSRLQVLKDTFPDADRDYLSELVNSCGTDEAKLQDTVSDMLEKRAYPKLKDQLERERKQALKKEYSSRIFTPEEVLQWFEDPISFFSNNSTPVSRNYEMHAYAQLHNEFPKLVLNDIKKALLNNKQHYTGAFHELKEKLQEECKTIKFKRRKARATMILPEEPDELFYRELAFTRIEEKVIDYLKTKEVQKSKRMEEAKANAELVTCACCFDDENLPEEMIDCGLGHLFCRECVRRGAEVAIGDGKSGLDCMSEKCHVKFELPALQLVLKPSMFSNLLKRIQAEEISNAEIPDLVQCPHCSFAAIMPNPDDKVFRCLNPECLKETCRFCKEPNHIPLRCEEVEKSDEVKMRTYIENKMTDALVRKCYRCSRRFMKEEGCNKMTCVCGATMCYVCRQPIKDYQHFQKGGCPQMSDTVRLHHDEVLQGAEKAKKEFVEQHPELKDTKLKHDPTKDLVNGEQPTPFAAGKVHTMPHLGLQGPFEPIRPRFLTIKNVLDYETMFLKPNLLRMLRGEDFGDEILGRLAPTDIPERQGQVAGRYDRPLAVRRRPGIIEKHPTPQHLTNDNSHFGTQSLFDKNDRRYYAMLRPGFVFAPQQYPNLSHLVVPKLPEMEVPAKPVVQLTKLFAGLPGDANGTPTAAAVTHPNPASNCAISSTSFNAQMKPRFKPHISKRLAVSRDMIKSEADSSSSAGAARSASLYGTHNFHGMISSSMHIKPLSYHPGDIWSHSSSNGPTSALDLSTGAKAFDQKIIGATTTTPFFPTSFCAAPIGNGSFSNNNYQAAGPSMRGIHGGTPPSTLNPVSSNSNNNPSSAGGSQYSSNSPTTSLGMQFENNNTYNITAHLLPATSASNLSPSAEYFGPNMNGTTLTNSAPVCAMPTGNNFAAVNYQAAGPSTSDGHGGNQNGNWIWRNPAPISGNCDKLNRPD